MRYRRFRTQDGKFLDALLTSDGEFNGPAHDPDSSASHKADHEAGYGIAPITVVTQDSDPWDGKSTLVTRKTARAVKPAPTIDTAATLEELKAAVKAEFAKG